METYHLNIKKVIEDAKDIKGLTDVVWLFDVKKGDEIIIEPDSKEPGLLFLKMLLIVIAQGILDNNPSLKTNENQDLQLGIVPIWNYNDLAIELTKVTGVKFSVSVND